MVTFWWFISSVCWAPCASIILWQNIGLMCCTAVLRVGWLSKRISNVQDLADLGWSTYATFQYGGCKHSSHSIIARNKLMVRLSDCRQLYEIQQTLPIQLLPSLLSLQSRTVGAIMFSILTKRWEIMLFLDNYYYYKDFSLKHIVRAMWLL